MTTSEEEERKEERNNISVFVYQIMYILTNDSYNDLNKHFQINLVRVAPDCNCSYCEDSFSGYSGSV